MKVMSEVSPRVQAWRALMLTHARVTTTIDEKLRAELDLPGTWYEALVEIAFAGGTMRMNEFAEETTLTKSGATRFVDRLEAAGLVTREICPTDRRAFYLGLTEKGRRIQKAADPYVLCVIDEMFGNSLSDEEAVLIRDALNRARLDLAAI